MARKPTTATITTIGHLSSGEVVGLESIGPDMHLTIDGVKVARRVNWKGEKSWMSVKQGWLVLDTNGPLSLQIKRDGKLLEWSHFS